MTAPTLAALAVVDDSHTTWAKNAAAIRWRAEVIDELIAHQDVWARIAEHAEAAAADRPDDYGRDVLVALSGCARVLAGAR